MRASFQPCQVKTYAYQPYSFLQGNVALHTCMAKRVNNPHATGTNHVTSDKSENQYKTDTFLCIAQKCASLMYRVILGLLIFDFGAYSLWR